MIAHSPRTMSTGMLCQVIAYCWQATLKNA